MSADDDDAGVERWLTLPSGHTLGLPVELRGDTPDALAARAAWVEMHTEGDAAAEAARHLGSYSREARRHRARARDAQERMLLILGYTREDVVARMSTRSQPGLDAIALIRY
jgi:hypothetical protein